MDKELEEAVKTLKKDINTPLFCGDVTIVCIEDLKTVLTALENSISKKVIEKKREETEKEYKYILGNMDRKIAKMKDVHKIRATYAEFGLKRGRLEILQELLEGK